MDQTTGAFKSGLGWVGGNIEDQRIKCKINGMMAEEANDRTGKVACYSHLPNRAGTISTFENLYVLSPSPYIFIIWVEVSFP